MTLSGLSVAYLRDRALNTGLNVLLLTLAVATMVILVLVSTQLGERFERDARGIDLVVGAKGSPMQLILSSVYHVDVPTGNIPMDALETLRRDPTVAKAIPLALGDNFRGFRIVGTETAYADLYGGRLLGGRFWKADGDVVVGSEVVRSTGATLGQKFLGSHGLTAEGGGEHEAHPFQVVGILRPTGTVLDRLILTSIKSVWDVHGVSGAVHDDPQSAHDGQHNEDARGYDEAHHDDAPAANASVRKHEIEPEATAILVSYRSPLAAVRLPAFINRQTELQAAVPAVETTRLLSLLGVGLDAARAFAALLLLSGGLSIFVALYTALRQREADMAMLRVMGATPQAIFLQVLSEGLLLAAAGAIFGLALGHGVVAIAASSFAQLREVGLTALRFEPAEGWIVLATLASGGIAALIPALRVFGVDIARTLAHAR